MRDTYLGLNQKNVLILKNKYVDKKGESLLKTEDLILIKRIQDFMASSETINVIINGKIYYWVHYENIQQDLPMIFPSIASVKKRIEKLKKLGLIINKAYAVTKAERSDDGFKVAGKYSVILLSKECRTMFDFTNKQNQEKQDINGGFYHEGVKGKHHEGVKGKHHEGVKGKHHEGVNKEYQEKNTMKNNTIHGMDFGIFEKLFKELKINFTRKNQESVKKLLMKMNEQEVLNYLKETHNNLQTDKTIKSIGGVFSKKIALGERQTQIKAKADEIAIENISTTNEIDYRGFNRKQKISLIEKELTTIEKNELKEKIRLGLTSELEFYDEEALNKIITEELESVLIRRFNKKYLTK